MEYIKGCATCQMTKVNTQPTRPPLFPIYSEINALPFQTISLDFIVKLPVSDGYDTILTITDRIRDDLPGYRALKPNRLHVR